MSKNRRLLTGMVLLLAFVLAGSLASPAIGAPAAQACVQLVVDGGFETGTGWTLGPNAAMPYYQTYAVHSGARALALGIPAGGNLKSFSSARQTLTIPAASGQALLSFWFYAIAEAPATTDYMEFVVLDPAGNILGKPWYSHNDSRVWNQMTLDLSQWRGQTIQLYFNVYNDGLGGKASMFLDDVSLTTCGGTPVTPGWTPTPTWTPGLPPPSITPSTTPNPGCVELVRNGNFSSLLSSWEPEGNLAGVGVASSPEPVRSSPHSLRLGSTGAVINGLSSARQPINIPAGYGSVALEAWVYPQAQINQGADYQELAILNSAGAVLSVPWRVVGTTGGWAPLAFDISQLAGQSIYIRFSVFNDGQGGQTVMFVDDVSIRACNPIYIPTSTPTVNVLPTYTPTSYVPPTYSPPPTYIPPSPGCVDLIQNPSFEYGLYPWQPGQGNLLPAQLVNAPVLSGVWSVRLGSTSQNRNSYSSIRQWVTIPGGYPQKVVSFFAYTYAESYAGADEQKFVILGPGDTVLAVPWKTLDNAQTWQQFVFDVSNITSNQFALYFAAINDGKGGRTALWVDEVHAYACTPGAVYPVPYQAPVGATTLQGTTALQSVPLTEPTYPYADTPAIDLNLQPGLQGGNLAPGLTPVAEPALIQVDPAAGGVEPAERLTPPTAWTQVAIETAEPAATPEVVAVQQATQPPDTVQPEGTPAVTTATPGAIVVPTPRVSVEVNTPASAPGFLERIGDAFNQATASWPQGGRTVVAILLLLGFVIVVFLIIRWIIRKLGGK